MAELPQQEEVFGKAYDFRLIKRLWVIDITRFVLRRWLLRCSSLGMDKQYLMKSASTVHRQPGYGGLQNGALLSGARWRANSYCLFHFYLTCGASAARRRRVAVFSHVQKIRDYFAATRVAGWSAHDPGLECCKGFPGVGR